MTDDFDGTTGSGDGSDAERGEVDRAEVDRAEVAFRAAFAREAGAFEAPLVDLADVAQPSRRRRWLAPLVAAVLVAMVGVGVAVLVGDQEATPSASDRAAADEASALRAGWRYESIGNVSIQVPDTWGYKAPPDSQWCVDEEFYREGLERPYVALPVGLSTLVGCMGTINDHPVFPSLPRRFWSTYVDLDLAQSRASVQPEEVTADGWTRIVRPVGTAVLTGYADAEHLPLIREVLGTAVVASADPLGCASVQPTSERPPTAFDVEKVSVQRIVVCQYAAFGGGHDESALLGSREIDDPAALLGAIKSAKAGGGPNRPRHCIARGLGRPDLVLLLDTADGVREMWGRVTGCDHHGLDDGTAVRELTVANCAPLWGGRVTFEAGDRAVFERCYPS